MTNYEVIIPKAHRFGRLIGKHDGVRHGVGTRARSVRYGSMIVRFDLYYADYKPVRCDVIVIRGGVAVARWTDTNEDKRYLEAMYYDGVMLTATRVF